MTPTEIAKDMIHSRLIILNHRISENIKDYPTETRDNKTRIEIMNLFSGMEVKFLINLQTTLL